MDTMFAGVYRRASLGCLACPNRLSGWKKLADGEIQRGFDMGNAVTASKRT